MKKQKNTVPEVKSNTLMTEEHEKDEVTAQTDHKLPADRQVMATHGFLKILSTVRKR